MSTTTDVELAHVPEILAAPINDALTTMRTHSPRSSAADARTVPRVLVVGMMPDPLEAKAFLDADPAAWWDAIETTLASAFESLKTAALMAEHGGGRIVLVADDAGICGTAHRSAESALGGAAIAMTKSLAREFSPRGVSVNAAAVQSDLLYGPGAETYRTQVGQLVAFLADDELAHLTGQIVPCNNSTIRTRV
ncbi:MULTISPECIES: SDR family oxidoreductase [unclassified Mycolicibacterium]|uniref:SDR family oxidoreductase n=1 Tax=unclassified Mycolicibacterium TaxID=2636767 RepID=UPI0012DF9EB6|nr:MULTISPECIES: SDR family oxidoreductase [unclassified Mycolicibacterium]MUL82256.1 SDR family oxidoreductase [Mycolicibacterium sp. CBMA 329]MUL88022.1 SDR family oxidoreductase [Mycolicibacterium sp. CBMA 331]MUM02353.1 SDR family oxidoreductase [Mycolicibacterium sp. CBMA 334]MUM29111.1 SDR family oxidoreductase [Mycolicibacterium sp. CBMA 295]MUM38319.1 SDR family oxidoreductase [Mycolicibacterium sp. CBMA 247]